MAEQKFDLKATLSERKGPLPVWGWLLALVALLVVVVWWRRNRAAGSATEAATGGGEGLPNQSAPSVFVIPQQPTPAVNVGPINIPATVPTAPPGAGTGPPGGGAGGAPERVSVPLGANIYGWIDQLNLAYPGLNLNFGRLDMLNPGWRKYIDWRANPAHPDYKDAFFYKPSGVPGVPPLRIR